MPAKKTNTAKNDAVKGGDLLYPYLRDLFKTDDPALQQVPIEMIKKLGVWFQRSSVYCL